MDQYNNGLMTAEEKRCVNRIWREQPPIPPFDFKKGDIFTNRHVDELDIRLYPVIDAVSPEEIGVKLPDGRRAVFNADDAEMLIRRGMFKHWKIEEPTY